MAPGPLAVVWQVAILMDVEAVKSWAEIHKLASNPLKFISALNFLSFLPYSISVPSGVSVSVRVTSPTTWLAPTVPSNTQFALRAKLAPRQQNIRINCFMLIRRSKELNWCDVSFVFHAQQICILIVDIQLHQNSVKILHSTFSLIQNYFYVTVTSW